METYETFTFEGNFQLVVRRDASGRKVLTLLRDRVAKDLMNPTLELLHYLVQHPHEVLEDKAILDRIWHASGSNIIEKHVYFLRNAMSDDAKDPTFIKTWHGRGYEFLLDVQREGGGIEVYPKWDRARFYELMRDLTRGPEEDEEDIRIVATGIGASLDEIDLNGLVRRKVRTKILFLDPKNKTLTHARYSRREDKPAARCIRELEEQIGDIKRFARDYPVVAKNAEQPGTAHSKRPSVEFGLSDLMPCGFFVHTREWAVVGIYLAHDSYTGGPMIEMRGGTEPWEAVYKDWIVRWKDFKENGARSEPADA